METAKLLPKYVTIPLGVAFVATSVIVLYWGALMVMGGDIKWSYGKS